LTNIQDRQSVTVNIGVNGAFLTRRWEDPENFIKLTRECGYKYHSFCADVLDPFFSGNKKYQLRTAAKIKKAAIKYGATIVDYYTGVATHRFHGLSHSNPAVRMRMKDWIIEAMNIAVAMGVGRIGGHWDALSVEVLNNQKLLNQSYNNTCNQFRELSKIAKIKGISAIYNEQMYIPSEKPWTLKEAGEFLIRTNKNNRGVPVRLTIDVGHQAGQGYGMKGKDADYIEWLKKFAVFTEIIHIQQTTGDSSHHWPFTDEYNRKGHIKIEKIIEAIRYSFKNFMHNPVSKYLNIVKDIYLIAEIIPASTKTERVLLKELKKTAEYLGKYVPEEGLKIRIEK
jgi:sugar phosphate isomerase/epimerase